MFRDFQVSPDRLPRPPRCRGVPARAPMCWAGGQVDLMFDALPVGFELSTVYSAAVSAKATEPALAGRFITLRTGPASPDLRQAAGFEA